MRTFIAIDLTPSLRQQVESTQRRLMRQLLAQKLDRAVRWVAVHNLHLTLHFLGEIEEAQLSALTDRLAAATTHHLPMQLRIEGVGCFPNSNRPNVIWCGVGGDLQALARLQSDVTAAVRSVGIQGDDKPFKPHLTIGRTQRNITVGQLRAVGAAVAELAALPSHASAGTPDRIDEVILYKSELTPSGPIYTRLGVFQLAQR
ncbi:MAG: RNA 2',3'-cyclic phosphodiesterase [Caldilinea sp.]|nr:RNA 2',3'-cyclic phosphodiesterase [Caldilinea sp.]MDW8441927.1 RNA 2',3'-cyclic phosphodiesterase [Caldilineaceae bacterium]